MRLDCPYYGGADQSGFGCRIKSTVFENCRLLQANDDNEKRKPRPKKYCKHQLGIFAGSIRNSSIILDLGSKRISSSPLLISM
jgi:hypothetical protein